MRSPIRNTATAIPSSGSSDISGSMASLRYGSRDSSLNFMEPRQDQVLSDGIFNSALSPPNLPRSTRSALVDTGTSIQIKELLDVIREAVGRSGNIKREIKLDISRSVDKIGKLLDELPGKASLPPPTPSIRPEEIKSTIQECIRTELRLLKPTLTAPSGTPQPAPATQTTYASVAARPAPPKAPPPSRHAIIVEKKGRPAQSATEVSEAWRKGISFKTATYAPARVQPISNNRLRIEFETEKQRDETVCRLKDSDLLSATTINKLKPMFILKGVSRDTSKEEIPDILAAQNPTIKEAVGESNIEIKLRFVRNNKNDKLYNAILITTPAVWKAAIRLERVNVDHQRVTIENFCPLLQCFKCLQYGHLKNNCTSSTSACSHCASTNHIFADCPHRSDPETVTCFNCKQNNQRNNKQHPTNHSATSNICTLKSVMYERVRSMTDYGN